eukprot:GFUD01025473.1.p1 GENE.GFUD01025473.1~~GFUD01025473.1.p1  ORF type:complete len:252 (+),score=43.39 GFUD01025473.1:62-817(+)
MDQYRSETKSELKNRFFRDLPRVKKLPSFYSRTAVQSPNTSVIVDQSSCSPSLTLKCPITRTRQTVPIRTTLCKHVETFDLYNFLDTLSFNDVLLKGLKKSLFPISQLMPIESLYSCPICSYKGALYIDSLVLSALTFFSSEILTVNISPAGLLFSPLDSVGDHSIVDLATTPTYMNSPNIPPPPEVTCSPLVTPDPFDNPLTGESSKPRKKTFTTRTFSFGDSCMSLGSELRVGKEKYRRLSTIDLSSPC